MMAGTALVPAIIASSHKREVKHMAASIRVIPEDIVDRGKRLYDERIRPLVEENVGKYLLIDVESGDWAMGDDTLELADDLQARHPKALLYGMRIGYRATARIGGFGWRRE